MRDDAIAVEGLVSLERLGFRFLADICFAALHSEGVIGVSDGRGCSSENWRYIFEHFCSLPQEQQNDFVTREYACDEQKSGDGRPAWHAAYGSKVTERKSLTEPRRGLRECFQRLSTLHGVLDSRGDGCDKDPASLRALRNACQVLSEYLETKRNLALRNMSLDMHNPYWQCLRDWRRGGTVLRPRRVRRNFGESKEGGLVFATMFEEIARLFSRRLTIYAHQFIQLDSGYNFYPAKVYHIRFTSGSGGSFLTAGDDGLLKIWDTETLQLCYTVKRHFSDIIDVDLCWNNELAVSCCSLRQLKLWKLGPRSWEPVGQVVKVSSWLTFSRFLPKLESKLWSDRTHQDCFLMTTCDDGYLRIYIVRPDPSQKNADVCEVDAIEDPLITRSLIFQNTELEGVVSLYQQLSATGDTLTLVAIYNLGDFVPCTFDMFNSTLCNRCKDANDPEKENDVWEAYMAMGLQYEGASDSSTWLLRLLVLRTIITYKKNEADTRALFRLSIKIQPHIFAVPFVTSSTKIPDVLFSSLSPDRLVSGSDNGQVLLWHFFSLKMCCLRTMIEEKRQLNEYRSYQHPLASRATDSESVASSLLTHVTSLAWADEDKIVVVGCSISRRTDKNEYHEKAVTRETELSFFEAETGCRLLSFADKKRIKSNISFIRPHPLLSSILLVGTYAGQILVLNAALNDILLFLSLCDIDALQFPSAGFFRMMPVNRNDPPSATYFETETGAKDSTTGDHVSPEANERPPGKVETRIVRLGGLTVNTRWRAVEDLGQTEMASEPNDPGVPSLVYRFLTFPKTCILDGHWLPTGDRFIVLQADGCFSIFTPNGCDNFNEVFRLNDAYKSTPVEQFFDGDFREFAMEPNTLHVYCPYTDEEPHQVTSGVLVDGNRVPLPFDIPIPASHFGQQRRQWDVLNDQNEHQGSVGRHGVSNALVEAYNRCHLDEYGNVAMSISYVPPFLRRRTAGVALPEPTEPAQPESQEQQGPEDVTENSFSSSSSSLSVCEDVVSSESSTPLTGPSLEPQEASATETTVLLLRSRVRVGVSHLACGDTSSEQFDERRPQTRCTLRRRRAQRSVSASGPSSPVLPCAASVGEEDVSVQPLSSLPSDRSVFLRIVRHADASSSARNVQRRNERNRDDERNSHRVAQAPTARPGRLRHNVEDNLPTAGSVSLDRSGSCSRRRTSTRAARYQQRAARSCVPSPSSSPNVHRLRRRRRCPRYGFEADAPSLTRGSVSRRNSSTELGASASSFGAVGDRERSSVANGTRRSELQSCVLLDDRVLSALELTVLQMCCNVSSDAMPLVSRASSFFAFCNELVSESSSADAPFFSKWDYLVLCRQMFGLLLRFFHSNSTYALSSLETLLTCFPYQIFLESEISTAPFEFHGQWNIKCFSCIICRQNGLPYQDPFVNPLMFHVFLKLCSSEIMAPRWKDDSRENYEEFDVILEKGFSWLASLLSTSSSRTASGRPSRCSASSRSSLQTPKQEPFLRRSPRSSAPKSVPNCARSSSASMKMSEDSVNTFFKNAACSLNHLTAYSHSSDAVLLDFLCNLKHSSRLEHFSTKECLEANSRQTNSSKNQCLSSSDGAARIPFFDFLLNGLAGEPNIQNASRLSGPFRHTSWTLSNWGGSDESNGPLFYVHPECYYNLFACQGHVEGKNVLMFKSPLIKWKDATELSAATSEAAELESATRGAEQSARLQPDMPDSSPSWPLLCESCNALGAVVCCAHCGSWFHWQCAKKCWIEAEEERQRQSSGCRVRKQFPDVVTWGFYVCPRRECSSSIRPAHSFMTHQLFATSHGISSRNWLLQDEPSIDAYIPQLGDVVRLFPPEALVSSVSGFPWFPTLDSLFLAGVPADAIVTDIRYEFPRYQDIKSWRYRKSRREKFVQSCSYHIYAVLSLLVLLPHPNAGRVFSVPYSPDSPQLVVLLSDVCKGLQQTAKLRPRKRVSVIREGSVYAGTVVKVNPDEQHVFAKTFKTLRETLQTDLSYIPPEPRLMSRLSRLDAVRLWLLRPEFESRSKQLVNDWKAAIADQNYSQSLCPISIKLGEKIGSVNTILFSSSGQLNGNQQITRGFDSTADATSRNKRVRRSSSFNKLPISNVEHSVSSRNGTHYPDDDGDTLDDDIKDVYCWNIIQDYEKSNSDDTQKLSDIQIEWFQESIQAAISGCDLSSSAAPLSSCITLRNRTVSVNRGVLNPEKLRDVFNLFVHPIPEPGAQTVNLEHQNDAYANSSWVEEYWMEIPLPISLDLIMRRLRNRYYRSDLAVLFDLQLLFRNSVQFNGENDVTTSAVNRLLSLISRGDGWTGVPYQNNSLGKAFNIKENPSACACCLLVEQPHVARNIGTSRCMSSS